MGNVTSAATAALCGSRASAVAVDPIVAAPPPLPAGRAPAPSPPAPSPQAPAASPRQPAASTVDPGSARTAAVVSSGASAAPPALPPGDVAPAWLVSVTLLGVEGLGAHDDVTATVTAGAAVATARVPRAAGGGGAGSAPPRVDLPVAGVLPAALRVELRAAGLACGAAELALAGDAGAGQRPSSAVAAGAVLLPLSGGGAAAAVRMQVACRPISTDAATGRAKLTYAASAGLMSVRLEAFEPAPAFAKRIAAVVGARATREGRYTLRLVLTHGLRAFESHAFAPAAPAAAANANRVGGAPPPPQPPPHISMGNQDCRVWVKPAEAAYLCPCALFVEAPRRRPGIVPAMEAFVPALGRAIFAHLPGGGGGAADGAASPAPPLPARRRLVLLARGYMDAARLQDGRVHVMRVVMVAAAGGARADLTDTQEALLVRGRGGGGGDGTVADATDVADSGDAAIVASDDDATALDWDSAEPAASALRPPTPLHVPRGSDADADADGAALDDADAAGEAWRTPVGEWPTPDGRVGDDGVSPAPPAAPDDAGAGFSSPDALHAHAASPAPPLRAPPPLPPTPLALGADFDDVAVETPPTPAGDARDVADVLQSPAAEDAGGGDGVLPPPAAPRDRRAPPLLGVLRVRAVYQPKPAVEAWFFSRLLAEFDADGDGQLQAAEFVSLLESLGSDLTGDETAQLVARIDADGDGVLRADELRTWLGSAEFQALPLGYALLSVLARGERGLDSVVNDITDVVAPASKASAAGAGVALIRDPSGRVVRDELGLYCVDRDTGLVVAEHIPRYVRIALRLMYQSQLGRSAVGLTGVKAALRRLSAREGALMNSPRSAHRIADFVRAFNIDLGDVAPPPPGGWRTFNDFFTRRLRDGARPVTAPDDPAVIVSPADCRLAVFASVGEATRLWVKGDAFTVAALLGPRGGALAPLLEGGAVAVARLAPQDYHRWHAPLGCTQLRSYAVEGALYTVNPMAIRQRHPSVFTENERRVVVLTAPAVGVFACVAVGATVVGSINVLAADGDALAKGAEHGYFAFGGSTVVLLFQPGAVAWDADLLANSGQPLETIVRVGARVGVAARAGVAAEPPPPVEVAAAAPAGGAAGDVNE